MDRNKLGKWLKSPAKMGHKYSLHVVYFCTGCGIIEVPPLSPHGGMQRDLE